MPYHGEELKATVTVLVANSTHTRYVVTLLTTMVRMRKYNSAKMLHQYGSSAAAHELADGGVQEIIHFPVDGGSRIR
eukprot:44525-Eustigmatos_ZCMA.PRE.1